MSKTLTVVCPWCNTRQKIKLKGMYHVQSTDDFHEFLCGVVVVPLLLRKND